MSHIVTGFHMWNYLSLRKSAQSIICLLNWWTLGVGLEAVFVLQDPTFLSRAEPTNFWWKILEFFWERVYWSVSRERWTRDSKLIRFRMAILSQGLTKKRPQYIDKERRMKHVCKRKQRLWASGWMEDLFKFPVLVPWVKVFALRLSCIFSISSANPLTKNNCSSIQLVGL